MMSTSRGKILFSILLLLAASFIIKFNILKTVSRTDSGQMKAVIQFLVPVKLVKSSSTVIPEYPTHMPRWALTQQNNRQITLTIRENIPYGQKIKLLAAYKPFGLPITLHTTKTMSNDAAPKLLGATSRTVPTDKPVEFKFNTFIEPGSFIKAAKASIPGSFMPAEFNNTGTKDYSRWLFVPETPLSPNQSFKVTFNEQLKTFTGRHLKQKTACKITAAVKPRILSCSITNGSTNVPLYPVLKFSYDQTLDSGSVIIKESTTNHDVPGRVKAVKNTIIFKPYNALLPGTKYNLTVKAASAAKESSRPFKISFTTRTMNNQYWMEVKLGNIHTVTVYKDRCPVRVMLASGGRSGHETPPGTYYTGDRGRSFWAARFGEGAAYWVRVAGSILIHSVPKNSRWQTKEEEHIKLGLPASHGCIRLAEPDAKWVYENIPAHTMIIIHD
ncbi:lipoprotein-anchoring transpeptidase ErfK/SrfK [Desulfohalotomaculum tongense]|uniref:L,D-transpeptidase family protein n=1 Tax=Desulforadius tongensis TaxID=1216062 RepID=UPI00195F191C|nr:Ig-like domain-containing protein [Desulforadius tongensis]MBM7855385.1 lipoprotein-anchoring transpeptidase ErfK/SrfK [Desulforadius tongensis]